MTRTAGALLRTWRRRRNLSQLALAHQAGVSARHVSFIETGRSRPTSAMLLRLCDQLEVPLREQNRVLLAGGHAPAHPEYALADPPMTYVHEAIEVILTGHLPYPALVVDQGWDLVAANDAVYNLLDGVAARLLEPPVNVIRLTLDPEGLASRIVNLAQWRAHLVDRLRREYEASRDERLAVLLAAVDPGGDADLGDTDLADADGAWGIVVPLRLRIGETTLSMVSATTVFGTPREVTLSEVAIETFYPADAQTREVLGRAGARRGAVPR